MRALGRWGPPAALFLATLFTTSWAGAFWAGLPVDVTDLPAAGREGQVLAVLRAGLPFSATLLAVLLAHEFGHFFAARAHGVECTPPYFLPMPLLTGTLGAVIRIRGRIPSLDALVDVGAAGPWGGVVVAVPLFALGLSWSAPQPFAGAPAWPPAASAWGVAAASTDGAGPAAGVLVEGQSLLTLAMRALFAPEVPPGHELALHPVAAAAWLGLLVTMLNLLPIGQLDGGHVTYALWGERARKVGRAAVALLVPLGIFAWAGWLLWALVGWRLVRTAHPPVASDAPLGPRRRLVARASLALFALTFMPLPVDVR